jgi:hypothetical protein
MRMGTDTVIVMVTITIMTMRTLVRPEVVPRQAAVEAETEYPRPEARSRKAGSIFSGVGRAASRLSVSVRNFPSSGA